MTQIQTTERHCAHTWRPIALGVQRAVGGRAIVYKCAHCHRKHTVDHDHPTPEVTR